MKEMDGASIVFDGVKYTYLAIFYYLTYMKKTKREYW